MAGYGVLEVGRNSYRKIKIGFRSFEIQIKHIGKWPQINSWFGTYLNGLCKPPGIDACPYIDTYLICIAHSWRDYCKDIVYEQEHPQTICTVTYHLPKARRMVVARYFDVRRMWQTKFEWWSMVSRGEEHWLKRNLEQVSGMATT